MKTQSSHYSILQFDAEELQDHRRHIANRLGQIRPRLLQNLRPVGDENLVTLGL
jgi:hypothetical protein